MRLMFSNSARIGLLGSVILSLVLTSSLSGCKRRRSNSGVSSQATDATQYEKQMAMIEFFQEQYPQTGIYSESQADLQEIAALLTTGVNAEVRMHAAAALASAMSDYKLERIRLDVDSSGAALALDQQNSAENAEEGLEPVSSIGPMVTAATLLQVFRADDPAQGQAARPYVLCDSYPKCHQIITELTRVVRLPIGNDAQAAMTAETLDAKFMHLGADIARLGPQTKTKILQVQLATLQLWSLVYRWTNLSRAEIGRTPRMLTPEETRGQPEVRSLPSIMRLLADYGVDSASSNRYVLLSQLMAAIQLRIESSLVDPANPQEISVGALRSLIGDEIVEAFIEGGAEAERLFRARLNPTQSNQFFNPAGNLQWIPTIDNLTLLPNASAAECADPRLARIRCMQTHVTSVAETIAGQLLGDYYLLAGTRLYIGRLGKADARPFLDDLSRRLLLYRDALFADPPRPMPEGGVHPIVAFVALNANERESELPFRKEWLNTMFDTRRFLGRNIVNRLYDDAVERFQTRVRRVDLANQMFASDPAGPNLPRLADLRGLGANDQTREQLLALQFRDFESLQYQSLKYMSMMTQYARSATLARAGDASGTAAMQNFYPKMLAFHCLDYLFNLRGDQSIQLAPSQGPASTAGSCWEGSISSLNFLNYLFFDQAQRQFIRTSGASGIAPREIVRNGQVQFAEICGSRDSNSMPSTMVGLETRIQSLLHGHQLHGLCEASTRATKEFCANVAVVVGASLVLNVAAPALQACLIANMAAATGQAATAATVTFAAGVVRNLVMASSIVAARRATFHALDLGPLYDPRLGGLWENFGQEIAMTTVAFSVFPVIFRLGTLAGTEAAAWSSAPWTHRPIAFVVSHTSNVAGAVALSYATPYVQYALDYGLAANRPTLRIPDTPLSTRVAYAAMFEGLFAMIADRSRGMVERARELRVERAPSIAQRYQRYSELREYTRDPNFQDHYTVLGLDGPGTVTPAMIAARRQWIARLGELLRNGRPAGPNDQALLARMLDNVAAAERALVTATPAEIQAYQASWVRSVGWFRFKDVFLELNLPPTATVAEIQAAATTRLQTARVNLASAEQELGRVLLDSALDATTASTLDRMLDAAQIQQIQTRIYQTTAQITYLQRVAEISGDSALLALTRGLATNVGAQPLAPPRSASLSGATLEESGLDRFLYEATPVNQP